MTPPLDTVSILIVDDTPSNLGVVVNLFESNGYRVAIAQNGEEGLKRAALIMPSLILLDVMMPGVDGFEICRQLKAQQRTRNIPVIFMTSLASVEYKVKGFHAGAVDYLTKPLQIDEVMARVTTHLKLHAAQKRLEEQNSQLDKHREELEQRVAERTAELAAREREFRTLAENLPDNMARYDRQCRIVYMNPRLESLLGYSLKEIMGKMPLEVLSGEIYAGYQAHLEAVIASGLPSEMELLLPDCGSGVRYHHIRFVAERNEQGEIIGALTIGRDITEGKRAELQLTLLGAAISQMHEAAYFVDDQARIFYVNAEATRQLGYSREEFLGMTVMDIAPGWTREMIVNVWQSINEGGSTFEAEHRCKDGKILPVEINVTQLKHGDQEFGLAMVRDITERKRAEEELVTREREFRTLAENAPDNIVRYDRQCCYVYANPQHEKTVGLPMSALIGKMPIECFPGIAEVVAYQTHIRAVIETGEPAEEEAIIHGEDGMLRCHYIRLLPERNQGGEITGVLAIGNDITERKRAERELHLLNRALDNAFDASYLIDEDLRLRYVNAAAVRALGYSREELLAMTLLDVDPNLTREIMREVMKQTVEGGSFRTIESSHRRKNGEIFPVEVGATVFIYEGERLHLTIVRDITERKESERKLHKQQEAIRAVLENSPDTIIRYDRECRRIYMNRTMQRVFKKPLDELLGTSLTEFSPMPEEYFLAVKSVIAYGKEFRAEIPCYDAHDELHYADLRFAPEFGAAGNVETVLVVGRDITAMKAIENELKEREQRYHEIFDNAVEGMYLLEVTQDGRFRNIEINPALAASVGIPREAMIGKFVDETVPEDVGRLTVEKYRRVVAAGETITENIELDLPIGKRCYYSTITPIYYGGRIHRLIGISRDITELKRVEQELQESRAQLRGLTAHREEAREEERKYIAREVHDELGQILTGLQLNISVLSHKFGGDSAVREHLKDTMILMDKALGVARNVASALRPAALDMGIVSALEWLAERFGSNTGIECRVIIIDEEIHFCEACAVALFRIVQESLTNIARHAKAKRVTISLNKQGENYVLQVSDNGVGFNVGVKKQNSFGLVGIRERVQMLGGALSIDSTPGKGSEIRVTIPVINIEQEKA